MGRRDRGAVAVILAICVSLVLLGVAAIALNTGSWYAERAQLQNGADAAALAVAQSCASGACLGSYALQTDLAPSKANSNANDNLATVDYVCGGMTSDASGGYATVAAMDGLTPCSDSVPSWTSTGCPPPPDTANTGFVNVHTSTKTSSSDTIPIIGGLNGKPEHIKTCAQASWGFPGKGTVAPFTLSQCEYVDDLVDGVPGEKPPYLVAPDFTPLPPAFPFDHYDGTGTQMPLPGGETVVALHGTPNALSGGSFDSSTDGFQKNSGNPAPNVSRDTSFSEAGAGSLKVAWTTAAAGVESAIATNVPTGPGSVPLTVGSVYQLNGWVYGAGNPSVQLFVKDGATVYTSPAQVGDGAWHQLTVEFTAANTKVDIGMRSASATTDGQITWLDEVDLHLKNNPRCAGVTPPTNPPSGWDQPGGFGWLADTDGVDDCSVTVNTNDTIWDNTGASLPTKCKTLLQNSTCNYGTVGVSCQPQVIYVPIFDYTCKSGQCDVATVCGPDKPPGSNGCYHFTGFAGFVVTGAQLNGSGGLTLSSFISNKKYCNGNDKCVYGFFIGEFSHLPNGGGGGANFGLSFFGLSG
jgi:Flp pilus assembly protein TadG